MTGDMTNLTLLTIYILSFNINNISSRAPTLWKLKEDKIVEAQPFHHVVTLPGSGSKRQLLVDDDPIFNIITSTVRFGTSWTKHSLEYYCTDCHNVKPNMYSRNTINEVNSTTDDEELDCGAEVNFTFYDNLPGVVNRKIHPNVPEPEVAQVFLRKKQFKKSNNEIDLDALEKRLKKYRKEKPKSIQLYNQIGNFWRLKGNTLKSIECFRRALAVSPYNAEVLLNLARVLFAVKYYEDAIYIAQRSLDVKAPDKNAWQQYQTLGELCRAMGRPQEAATHFRIVLDLRPNFEGALIALKEIENQSNYTIIHMYTFIIIICLVSLVMCALLIAIVSLDTSVETDYVETKTIRHFNRAMAMRSLRRNDVPSRPCRGRKSTSAN